MATRSLIGKENEDGTITYVYCHFDGYIDGGVGETLYTIYNTPEAIDAFLALGDLSTLRDTLDSGATVAYHRDRGEDWETVAPKTADSYPEYLSVNMWTDYKYLFSGGKWTVIRAGARCVLGTDETGEVIALDPTAEEIARADSL